MHKAKHTHGKRRGPDLHEIRKQKKFSKIDKRPSNTYTNRQIRLEYMKSKMYQQNKQKKNSNNHKLQK